MKRFILIVAICMFSLSAVEGAADVRLRFTWNHGAESDLAGFRLYQSEVSGQYIDPPILTIPYADGATTSEDFLIALTTGTYTYYFVMTAYDTSGNETGYSNEVSQVIDLDAGMAPFSLTVTIVSE